jgi:hypothetical protein
MATRIIVGLTLVVAIVMVAVPDADAGGIVSLALIVLGVAYAWMAVDANDATTYLVVVIAGGAAAQADVLGAIPAIGAQLDGILDGVITAAYASAITVLTTRVVNQLKG